MIDTFYFGIGFFIYVAFCLITFDVYSKKEQGANPLILLFIFLYYTLLTAYLINLVDVNGTFIEKTIEFLIYSITGGILCLYYYRNVIDSKEEKKGFRY